MYDAAQHFLLRKLMDHQQKKVKYEERTRNMHQNMYQKYAPEYVPEYASEYAPEICMKSWQMSTWYIDDILTAASAFA